MLIVTRMSGASSSVTALDMYGSPPLPALTADASSLSSPSRAIYLLTLPLALLWAGMRWMVRPLTTPHHPVLTFLRPILISSSVVFVAVAIWYMHAFATVRPPDWNRLLITNLLYNVWLGYLDMLHIPAIFNDRWHMALAAAHDATEDRSNPGRSAYMHHWYRQGEILDLIVITAARHGLGVAIVVTAWKAVRRVFS